MDFWNIHVSYTVFLMKIVLVWIYRTFDFHIYWKLSKANFTVVFLYTCRPAFMLPIFSCQLRSEQLTGKTTQCFFFYLFYLRWHAVYKVTFWPTTPWARPIHPATPWARPIHPATPWARPIYPGPGQYKIAYIYCEYFGLMYLMICNNLEMFLLHLCKRDTERFDKRK